MVGIGPAAQYYFKKRPSQLTEREAAILASLLPSPRIRGAEFHKGKISRHLAHAMQRTLRHMHAADSLLQLQAAEARRASRIVRSADAPAGRD